jgi:hypothetical protein
MELSGTGVRLLSRPSCAPEPIPRLPDDRGSTASDLAHWTTGRGGAGSEVARGEQRIIIELLGSTGY